MCPWAHARQTLFILVVLSFLLIDIMYNFFQFFLDWLYFWDIGRQKVCIKKSTTPMSKPCVDQNGLPKLVNVLVYKYTYVHMKNI